MNTLEIPPTDRSPRVHVHVNPSYTLYHWLRTEAAKRPESGTDDIRMENALALIRRSVNLRGVHGVWDVWEEALVSSVDQRAPFDTLGQAIATTGRDLIQALEHAEPYFRTAIWPARKDAINGAVATIRETFAPRFPTLAAQHAALLDLRWPESIDVYLVFDCYDFGGAYSHPLTIDVVKNTGLVLCETLLHEATHVADVIGGQTGSPSLGDRLMFGMVERGLDRRAAFNRWHAIIFAASAARIRATFDAEYGDYASDRNLYDWFRVPDAPMLWRAFEADRDEAALVKALYGGGP